MTNRHPRSTWLVPVALGALAAVAAVVVVLAGRGGPGGDRQDDTAPPAVAVSSDAPTHRSLDQLVAAGDVVVRGTVEAAERGRWFGSGGAGEARVQSRVLTVRVTDVLAGTAPTGDAVLVEEEGWLDDGRPVVVDGTAPVEVGDEAVWFLAEAGDPDLGAYVLVNFQGRYPIAADGSVTGADGHDPLVDELTALDVDGLTAAIRGTG